MNYVSRSQEREAENIKKVATDAVTVSAEAFNTAKNAINEQKTTKDELGRLRQELEAAAERLDKTKQLALDAKEQAARMLNESLAIYAVVYGLKLPEPDVQTLRDQVAQATKEAARIRTEAGALLGDHNDLLEELAEQSVRLRDLLKLGEEQQQRADELLVDADGADSDAQEAVRLGDKTLAEAQETLRTLQGW
jgi:laminin, gamma 1